MKQIKYIEELEQFDEAEFASWLRCGFEDIKHPSKSLTAFAPLNYFIGYHENIIEDLKTIYDELSGTTKRNFRLGLKRAFSELPPESYNVSLISLFLYLAGKIRAVEILPEIVKQIGNGYFGIQQNDEGAELFALSLDIVSGMATYCKTGDVVKKLVASRFFKPEYAPMAFIALCRAEPENFPEHLNLLRPYFYKLHLERGTDDAYLTAIRFVQFVDLDTISKNLWMLYFTKKPSKKMNSDNWFAEALFLGDKAPLLLDKNEHFYIRRTSSEYEGKYTVRLPYFDMLTSYNDITRFFNQIVERIRTIERSLIIEPPKPNSQPTVGKMVRKSLFVSHRGMETA